MAESLVLYGNRFQSGEIPSAYYNLTMLQVLDMSNCNITGPIDGSITNLVDIQELYLENNMLTGVFPSVLNLANLGTLHGNSNASMLIRMLILGSYIFGPKEKLYLSGNGLTGQLPAGVWDMSSLVELSLSSNVGLSGQIGASIGNMTELSKFLSHHQPLAQTPHHSDW